MSYLSFGTPPLETHRKTIWKLPVYERVVPGGKKLQDREVAPLWFDPKANMS